MLIQRRIHLANSNNSIFSTTLSSLDRMSDLTSSFLYQSSPDAALKAHFLNQNIDDVQAPAAIIDAAVVRRNCQLMLSSAQALKVSFRAHVKTHKVCLDST
jgi:hypothetical protein